MSQTQDRKKQRQAYLKQKRIAYTRVALASLCALLLAWGTYWLLYDSHSSFLADVFQALVNEDLGLIAFMFYLFVIGLTVLCGVGTYRFARSAQQVHQEAKQIPYVPPVTADSLPAEEVLVRGSEEPAQEQGKVLLRGTDSSADTGEQELLRSSQGQGQG